MCDNDVPSDVHVVVAVERLLRFEHLSFSLFLFLFFLTLFYMGALTKRPLFILFCQQPKRRGECPPNAIIQSTPLKDIHASHSRKLTISVLAIPNLLSRLSPSPAPILPLLSSSFFSSFILWPRYVRSRSHPFPARTFPRDELRVPSSRTFPPFPIVDSPRDSVPVARISSIERRTNTRKSACKM